MKTELIFRTRNLVSLDNETIIKIKNYELVSDIRILNNNKIVVELSDSTNAKFRKLYDKFSKMIQDDKKIGLGGRECSLDDLYG